MISQCYITFSAPHHHTRGFFFFLTVSLLLGCLYSNLMGSDLNGHIYLTSINARLETRLCVFFSPLNYRIFRWSHKEVMDKRRGVGGGEAKVRRDIWP